jgi:hypothetical protein
MKDHHPMKSLADIEAQSVLTERITRSSLALQVVARLADFYVEAGYAENPESFKEDHFRPMYADATMRATDLEQQLYHRQKGEEPVTFLDLLVLSCAYCVEAIRAYDSPDRDDTWIFASYAQYWLGVASGSRLVSGAGALALRENAKSGRRARDKPRDELRALARQIATSRWFPSKRQAALAALPEVLARAEILSVPMHLPRAEKTITEWLDGVQLVSKQHP